uniref:Uncharacterized protein n=1 Tax=Myripristis murdjan TaxID=586833 RepID=A0A668AKG3_9TELE
MQLLCWGDSSSGQFGPQGALAPASWTPPEVISSICCGDQHTLFLTRDGDVLSSGGNSFEQLGRQRVKDAKKPGWVVKLFPYIKPIINISNKSQV